jgi:flagellar hook-basal body complex protein FliE
MSGVEAIGAISVTPAGPAAAHIGAAASPAAAGEGSFASILADGFRLVESRVATANDLVRQFAIDDSVPLHHVTYALEEARLAVELAMQVRGRLVETYRELMNMQL